MKVLKVILFVWIIVLGMVISSHASTQYLFPTDCANLDEQSIHDADTSAVALTTTETVCTMSDLSGTGYSIARVSIIILAKRTTGTPNILPGIKIGTNYYNCTRYVGYIDYIAYGCDWETSPSTLVDWTISEVNGLVGTAKESTNDVVITQMYIVVTTNQEDTSHSGVLLPGDMIKYGVSLSPRGHAWYTSSDTDTLSPQGTNASALWWWKGDGHIQSEGYYLGIFSTDTSCHTYTNGYWGLVIGYQPGGTSYELRISCDGAANEATLRLVRYSGWTATLLDIGGVGITSIQVSGSNINSAFSVLAKVSGITNPTFIVSIAGDTTNGKNDNIFSYTDTGYTLNAGRFGFRIDEGASNYYGQVRFYSLSFGSSFGIKVTNIPTGYSARIKDRYGNVLTTVAESSGMAIIPWQGYKDEVFKVPNTGTSGIYIVGMPEGLIGSLEIIDTSSNIKADTGILFPLAYGQVWNYLPNKLYDYRLGAVEDSASYSNKRRIHVWYQLDRSGTVTASCTPSCIVTTSTPHTKKNDNIGTLQFDELSPSTIYYYTIFVDGNSEGTGNFNSGPLSVSDVDAKICWSSCISPKGKPFGVANSIANAKECDMFVLQGDAPYADDAPHLPIGSNPTYVQHLATFYEVAATYKSWRTDSYWRTLFHNIPVVFILNDHEVCDNYSQGDENRDPRQGTSGSCSGWPIEASKKAYKLYSHYGNPASPKTDKYWYSMKWGKSDNYFPDQVFERNSPESNTDFLYYYGQNPTGSEIQPSCTRDATTQRYLNCTSVDFTDGSNDPDIDDGTDGDAMVLFPNDSTGKYYQIISIVDADTLELFRDEDEDGTNDNIAVGSTNNARIWKDWKNSHGADQIVWLFNKWRAATNSIQIFWSSYPLFGHRVFTGINKYSSSQNADCAYSQCGFGYEHDLIISELQILSQSGSGKKVLLPVGDEHTVRLSKWSTYDIYEFLTSGLGRYNGDELHRSPTEKEGLYPGLSIKLDAGGQSNWALLTIKTSPKTWNVEIRNDSNTSQALWDGSKLALGTSAWVSAERGLDNTVNAWRYPEWMFHNNTNHIIKMSSGYCWKIGTKYNDSNKTMIRRSADTACQDWLSANSYTYNLNSTSTTHTAGSAISLNVDESAIIVFYYDTGSVGRIKKCVFTGAPPTISSCSSPTGNVDLENTPSLLVNGNNIHLTIKDTPALTNVGMVTSSDGLGSIGAVFKANSDTDTTNPHFSKIQRLNISNDIMLMWFVGNTNILSARKCVVGGDGLCTSGEMQTKVDIVTDTNISWQGGGIEVPDFDCRGDGTCVAAYITKSDNTDARTQLKYSYYNGTSWSSPIEVTSNIGWRLYYANVFHSSNKFFIAVIDESTSKIILYQSDNGTTWSAASAPFEDALGKIQLEISQIDSNTVFVSYLSTTDAISYIENDEKSVWGQSATQIWTYSSGQWRLWNVNPNHNTINRSIN